MEERHVMKHILSIMSSTCTWKYVYAGNDNWEKMSLWTLYREIAQPPYGPTRPCQGGRIQEKHPRAIPHPWITFVLPLKGGR